MRFSVMPEESMETKFCPNCKKEQSFKRISSNQYLCYACGQDGIIADKKPSSGAGLAVAIIALVLLVPALLFGFIIQSQRISTNLANAEKGRRAWEQHLAEQEKQKYQNEIESAGRAVWEKHQAISEIAIQPVAGSIQSNPDAMKADIEKWFRLNESSSTGDFMAKLLPMANLSFRGLHFGMTANEVKAHEATRLDSLFLPLGLGGDVLMYLYYLEDAGVGSLTYNFNSTGHLHSIVVAVLGPPIPESEATSIMDVLVPAFSSNIGQPKKHSDYAYEWSAPALKSFLFAFPSKQSAGSIVSQIAIIYASPNSVRNADVNKMREDFIKDEKMGREMFERVFQ